jgi:hypothetical protein
MWLPAVFGLGAPDSDRGSSWAIKVDGDLGDDANRLYMAQATVVSGQAKGRKVYIALQDGRLVGERMTSPDMFDGVEAGDEVQIDNRNLICWAHRWMYSIDLDRWTIEDPTSGERVLAPEFAGLGFLLADGRPIYPQRQGRVLPISQYGRLERKVIHVACTHDTIVPLPSVGHYHRMVREHHGANTDDIYRLWWHENGAHGAAEILLAMTTPDTNPALWHSRMVPYDGAIQHALVSIVRWVEDDIAPAPTTSYRFTDDSGLVLPETAADRGGVQAVVQALANGARRADVKVGEPVTLRGTAEQPALGVFAWAKWDPEGTGDFVEEAIDASTADLTVEITHSYEQPGTYFPSFRVGAHPDSSNARGLPIENSARTRVVVSER